MPSVKPGYLTTAERHMLKQVMFEHVTTAWIKERDVVAWTEPHVDRAPNDLAPISRWETTVLGALVKKGLVKDWSHLGRRYGPLELTDEGENVLRKLQFMDQFMDQVSALASEPNGVVLLPDLVAMLAVAAEVLAQIEILAGLHAAEGGVAGFDLVSALNLAAQEVRGALRAARELEEHGDA